MVRYRYNNPEYAYKEALRRIKKAREESSTTLWLDGLGLTTIPPEIDQLTVLTQLWLQENKLTVIPPEIWRLTSLKELNLNQNQLAAIPPEIGQLIELTQLRLHGNKLTSIPFEITQLTKLETLRLAGNPNLLIPPEILARKDNAQAILDYLREQQEASARPLNEAKLILVGQGVGKPPC
ncbi:MAG: leucine-rich repeat domain-containing protein [Ardenticatenaceae bacterium]|nr:leucine-rich repeat domain-containing protein [Ardenticatenaceae bacterium]